jgi:oxygen-independent coproporphyrinogen-3 oxidase
LLGIYIHIPFCRAICTYCNFNRGLFDGGLKDRYLEALQRHIAADGDGARADTIYFGGGTPSMLAPPEIAHIIHACREAFDVTADAEVTLEMNPEDAETTRLAAYRAAGVNRLSVGVQSFHDDELKRLGRVHDVGRARDGFRQARAAGFDNISLDLMMWLPQQTTAMWRATVDALIGLGPDHASLYMLELYPNAPLRDEMARAGWSQAPDEDAAEMYLEAFERLERAGYEQYEISNVAKPGRRSRHNLKYWTDGEWLAFGCGAHGTRDGVRWRVVSDTPDYIARVTAGGDVAAERRVLSSTDRFAEAMITGLRLTDGVDLALMKRRFDVDVVQQFGAQLVPFAAAGLVIIERGRMRLTRQGMLLANEILTLFV